MTTEQLQYFLAIVRTGSFSQAALELNISQSAISKQIKSLENELGVQLFSRRHRLIELTQEGINLLPQIKHISKEFTSLIDKAQSLKPYNRKKITIVTLPFLNYSGLVIPIQQFVKRNPKVITYIKEVEEPTLLQKVSMGTYDIAITYWNEKLEKYKNSFTTIIEDEIILVVHRNNSLARLDYISPEILSSVPLLVSEPYTYVFQLCMDYFEEHHINPNIVLRGRPETIYASAETKLGFALQSYKHAKYLSSKDIILIPLKPSLKIALGIIVNKKTEKDLKVQELIKELRVRSSK